MTSHCCAGEPAEGELPGLPEAAAPALLMTSQRKHQSEHAAVLENGKTGHDDTALHENGVAEVRVQLRPDSEPQPQEPDDAAEQLESSQLLPRQQG